ncbi:cytochrome P450 [Pilatotrama ljubarskyi]|nr:cytochrome P450 [Pilatotrama ljubarskyi]
MSKYAVLCLVAAAWIAAWRWHEGRRAMNLPPGPKPHPIIGNLFDLTLKEPWLRALTWAEEYGNVVYLSVFGQGILFLNSYEAAVDLLEKRGAAYADKPRMVMCAELCGCEKIISFAGYGEMFRRQRRFMNSALGAASVTAYRALMMRETCAFLKRLIESPENHRNHIRRYIGAQTLSIVYGYRVTTDDDPHLERAAETLHLLSNHIASAGAGMWLVDIFPSLKARIEECADAPFEWVKENMEKGTATPCYCTTLLGAGADPKEEPDIKWTASTIYIGSVDTTLTTLCQFILAMIQYPNVMRKAQEEIDALTKRNRLPTHDDRPFLPYVEAVMKECLRWAAPVPLSLPHSVMEDDVYQGMLIPKGTLVFPNVWKMSRNPDLFPAAADFVPERHLEDVDEDTARKRDPKNYVFGFGRRRCPGVNLADSSLWIAVACMLATLDFVKAKDASGNVLEPQLEYNDASFRLPAPFPCVIKPRSEEASRLVHESAATYT